ncbi:NAD(P)-binding protein [Gonapodya prolifera JEL478]|uniref:NAD(P)-binding protein n=1 Tax=Gonapodya prolifera (strain JEL478) TaxID=1344416 RepID=A0A139AIB5_GONPJ|nr:NAD(P)-binding protein [Gonapodya prolifera JEL478]|eukprot:KXS16530.1 NAD(P)-binding protein [Gonapodya prolifera JEL478]
MTKSSRPVTFKYTDVPDLTGQVALITGASTGIGKATLSALGAKGAHVVCVGRNPEKSKAAIDEVVRATGNTKVDYIEADLNDLASVNKAASAFLAMNLPLHMLVLNAGVMALPKFELSKDGIEQQFATNHFAHFLLTERLLPTLEQTALSGAHPVRVVSVSSGANLWAPKDGIHMDQLNDEKWYQPMRRYGETKLANILMMQELQRRLEAKHGKNVKIYCNSLHPGVVRTELGRYQAPQSFGSSNKDAPKMVFLDPVEGAISSVYLATSPDVPSKNIRGQYYWDQGRVARKGELHAKAGDLDHQKTVWVWSENVIKQKMARL